MELKDISEFIIDCEHKTAPTQDEGYPSIRTPNIGRGNLILEGVNRVSEEIYREWTKRGEPQEDDLIIAREAPVGNVAIIPKGLKVCLGQRTVLVRPDKLKVNPKYLCYFLLAPELQNQIQSKTTGATVAHLNMSDIRELKIKSIPPLPIQRKIANILSAYDELIENNKKRIKLLEEMAEEIYKEWFVHMRFPGYEKTKFFNEQGKQVPHGTNGALPEGWEKHSFGKYIFYQEGPGLRNWQWTNSGIKVINVKNILGDGNIDVTNTDRFISIEEFKKTYKHFEVSENDIVIASSGNTYGKVGKILSIHLPLLMNTSVIRFNTKDAEKLPPSLLQAYLFSHTMKSQIEQYVVGSAQPNFGPSHIQKMNMILPDLITVKKIDKILSPIFSEVDILRIKNILLQETRDLLLPRLMSGKLNVENLAD